MSLYKYIDIAKKIKMKILTTSKVILPPENHRCCPMCNNLYCGEEELATMIFLGRIGVTLWQLCGLQIHVFIGDFVDLKIVVPNSGPFIETFVQTKNKVYSVIKCNQIDKNIL